MTLWFVLGLMTVLALGAAAWPLARGRVAAAGASDVAVYRDQLEEIERDRADGRIGHDEFEAARVEVSRRLLGAAASAVGEAAAPRRWRRFAALAGIVAGVPLVAVPFYAVLGSPQLPGEAFATREAPSMPALIARIEQHLAESPDDGRGWEVIAPVYMRLERYDDAVKARRRARDLLGPTPQREVDLGESLAMAAGGQVTGESKAAFARAAAAEAGNVKAMFYLGVAAQQAGDDAEAARVWGELVAGAPPDAPWLPLVREQLAGLANPGSPGSVSPGSAAPGAAAGGAPPPGPGPTADDVAAAGRMAPEARGDFVRSMVDRLATRLHEDGSDVDGWLRLLRAYMVMGERDKARAAVGEAREALSHEPEKLKLLDAGLQGLGVRE